MRNLLFLLAVLIATYANAAEYFVSTTGSTTNNGLSTGAPWPLQHALSNAGASNVVNVAAGTYSGAQVYFGSAGMTLRSTVKWGARITAATAEAIYTTKTNSTIDGFEVAYNFINGVGIYGAGGTVKNCWIHHNGTNQAGLGNSGISAASDDLSGGSGALTNMLFENNLIEYNGTPSHTNHDHGMYVAGTNLVIRGNVCRYNAAAGIQVSESGAATGSKSVSIYNNLCYSNGSTGIILGSANGALEVKVYGNTSYGNRAALGLGGTSSILAATNNILLGLVYTLDYFGGSATITGNYNLMSIVDSLPLGANGILTNNASFVNANNGLYWLKSDSPARGAAKTNIFGPVNFFGQTQTSVNDIGAFQYDAVFAADVRVLDPSPVVGADYWLQLQVELGVGSGSVGSLYIR